jgi:hypothetical protein
MATIKKAQGGKKVIKGSRPGLGVFRTEKERTTVGGIAEPYKYKRESIDTTGYSKGKPTYQLKTEEGEGDKTGYSKVKSSKSKTVSKKDVPSVLSSLKKQKTGGITKAKEGKWIQKATASIKRRGTEGKCTPITKPGCTGKAKSLAKTFKKMAKARKK